MDVKKGRLFSSTQLPTGLASGSTSRLLSSEELDWPLLNVRPWMGWTRKALFLRLLSLRPRTTSVTWERGGVFPQVKWSGTSD